MPHELTLSGLLQPPSVCATLYHVSKLASKNHPDSRYMRGTFRVFNATEFEIETGEWEVGAYPVSTMYRFEPIIIIPQTGVGEVFTPEKLEEENFNRPLWEKVAVFILECLIELTATHRELIENDMRIEEAGTDAEQALLPKKT